MATATRTVVKCYSHTIPGDPASRRETMANIICQYRWHRDFDQSQDSLRSLGQYAVQQIRCYFLLDNGPPLSESLSVYYFFWDGHQLREKPVTPRLNTFLKRYAFNQPEKTVLLSDDEFKAKYGEERYKKLVLSRIQQRIRWGHALPADESEFLKKYPELNDGI